MYCTLIYIYIYINDGKTRIGYEIGRRPTVRDDSIKYTKRGGGKSELELKYVPRVRDVETEVKAAPRWIVAFERQFSITRTTRPAPLGENEVNKVIYYDRENRADSLGIHLFQLYSLTK